MATQLAPERDFRGPGCTDACVVVKAIVPGWFGRTDLLMHDHESHEAYGWNLAVGGIHRKVGEVRTGVLAVDPSELRVTVGAEDVTLTRNELGIIVHLAAHLGSIRTYQQIVGAVWGPDEVPIARRDRRGKYEEFHNLRVHACRLRLKLGPAGRLIKTVVGVGLKLSAEPPIESALS